MAEIPLAYTNQEVMGRNKKSPVALIVVVVVVVAVIGFFVFRQSKKSDQVKTEVAVTKEATPTEKPKIDKTRVKIQVQNGTGTPGQAGTVVDVLKKAGYSSDNIKTANAKEYTNKITIIAAKTGFEDVASDVKTSLESTFTEINIDKTSLDSTGDFDIVVTTGGKLFEETLTKTPTATETATPTPTP